MKVEKGGEHPSRRRKKHRRKLSQDRNFRTDLPSVAGEVWRNAARGSQAARRTRGRKQTSQKTSRRIGTRKGRLQNVQYVTKKAQRPE